MGAHSLLPGGRLAPPTAPVTVGAGPAPRAPERGGSGAGQALGHLIGAAELAAGRRVTQSRCLGHPRGRCFLPAFLACACPLRPPLPAWPPPGGPLGWGKAGPGVWRRRFVVGDGRLGDGANGDLGVREEAALYWFCLVRWQGIGWSLWLASSCPECSSRRPDRGILSTSIRFVFEQAVKSCAAHLTGLGDLAGSPGGGGCQALQGVREQARLWGRAGECCLPTARLQLQSCSWHVSLSWPK